VVKNHHDATCIVYFDDVNITDTSIRVTKKEEKPLSVASTESGLDINAEE